MVQNLLEITLCLTVFEIKTFFRGTIFKVSSTQRVQNMLEIALSLTVFKMSFSICAKILDSLGNLVNSTFFRGTITKISSTQRDQNLLTIGLSATVFKINNIFDFRQNSRWLIKFGEFNIFHRHYK